jgi:hypothetical protein
MVKRQKRKIKEQISRRGGKYGRQESGKDEINKEKQTNKRSRN